MQEFQTYRLAPLLALPVVPEFWLDEIGWFLGEPSPLPPGTHPPHHAPWACPFGEPVCACQNDVFPLGQWYDDGFDGDEYWEEDVEPPPSLQYGFSPRCYQQAPYAQPMRWLGALPDPQRWRH